MAAETKPLVSVVIPVYNAGKYIRRCIECLIYQTLSPIEIIFVDKASTDQSVEILKEYQKQYPDKLFIYSIPYTDTPAAGRNFGIKMARAKYIGFSDADDILSYDAMEMFYNEAVKGNYDIVYSQFYEVEGKLRKLENVFKTPIDKDELIKSHNISFWNKMIKRSVLIKEGDIAADTIFDDFSYMIPLLSKIDAKKIGYVPKPLYYHLGRDDSESHASQSARMIHAVKAAEDVINNSKACGSGVYRIAKWMIHNITYRWRFADEFIDYLKKNKDLILNNEYIIQDAPAYKRLLSYISETDEKIPTIVYVNGFGKTVDPDKLEYYGRSVFNSGGKVIALNEDNCDMNENQSLARAYSDGNYDFVCHYFALKRIYEDGGFYIGDRIRVDTPVNALRRKTCVFGYLDNHNYSDQIFGGTAGNIVCEKLLETYKRQVYSDEFYPLADRIKNVLTARFGFPLDGKTHIINNIYVASAYEMSMYPLRGTAPQSYHFTSLMYKDMAQEDGYVTIKERALYSLAYSSAEVHENRESGNTGDISSVKKQITELRSQNENLMFKNIYLAAQLSYIRNCDDDSTDEFDNESDGLSVKALKEKNEKLIKRNSLLRAQKEDMERYVNGIRNSKDFRMMQQLMRIRKKPLGRFLYAVYKFLFVRKKKRSL